MIKCKLCLEIKTPCKAHLVPQFHGKELFDEKHKAIIIPGARDSRRFKVSSLEYDETILCTECDRDIIGRFEDYAAKVLYSNEFDKSEQTDKYGKKYVLIENVDYKKFKIYLLSLIWRFSITERPLFTSVNLGKKYEEEIRLMLYNQNPGAPDDFPCMMYDIRSDDERFKGIFEGAIEHPKKDRRDHNISYICPIAGFFYRFFISKYRLPSYVSDTVIGNTNKLKIYKMPEDVRDEYASHLKTIVR